LHTVNIDALPIVNQRINSVVQAFKDIKLT